MRAAYTTCYKKSTLTIEGLGGEFERFSVDFRVCVAYDKHIKQRNLQFARRVFDLKGHFLYILTKVGNLVRAISDFC